MHTSQDKLHRLRSKLHETIAAAHGDLHHPAVIRRSQLLDQAVNEAMRVIHDATVSSGSTRPRKSH